jgi:hypothetical protein
VDKARRRVSRAKWLKTATGLAYAERRDAKVRNGFTKLIREQKARPCTDCGGVFPPCAMDFDHVRGEKLFNLCRGAQHSALKVQEEIAKCDLVCSNCHRVRTTIRRYGKI